MFGASRSAPGRQVRQGYGVRSGPITDRDDVWAAILLCYYIGTGQDFTDLRQLADWSAGGGLAADIAAGPEACQSAHDILTARLGASDPVPLGIGSDQTLAPWIKEFFDIRAVKHPAAVASWASQQHPPSNQRHSPDSGFPDQPSPNPGIPNQGFRGQPPPDPPPDDDRGTAAAQEATPGRKDRRWRLRR